MRQQALSTPENTSHEVMQWLKKNVALGNKVQMLSMLSRILPQAKPGSVMQRDIVENMIALLPDASHIAPVETIEILSKSVLWAGDEYIPHFARAIMLVERPAIVASPNRALAAIEESLMICYSVILPRNIHGVGRCNDQCIAWQRYTFSSVLYAIETRRHLIDPDILRGVLKISEIMTGLTAELRDLNEKIAFAMHEKKPEHLAWH